MTVELYERLRLSGALPEAELTRLALDALRRERPLLAILGEERPTLFEGVERQLLAFAPRAPRAWAPSRALYERLAPGCCERLLAVPIAQEPRTGTVDVACADPDDATVEAELGHQLRASIRRWGAPLDELLDRLASLARARPTASGGPASAPLLGAAEDEVAQVAAALGGATSPEELTERLARGLARLARVALVLSVRSGRLEGRASSLADQREEVRALRLPIGAGLAAALAAGAHRGALVALADEPRLGRLLGLGPSDEAHARVIAVEGRPALVVLVAEPTLRASFDHALEGWAAAASAALEQLLISRKANQLR